MKDKIFNMIIYFDGGCGFCKKCVRFVEDNLGTHLKGGVRFENIFGSKYENMAKVTIAVVGDDGREYFYGEALKEINRVMKWPYRLGYYLPNTLANILYWLMKKYR
jgi:predicted DCC family thiol-disulfide oxidoreductase YuxK